MMSSEIQLNFSDSDSPPLTSPSLSSPPVFSPGSTPLVLFGDSDTALYFNFDLPELPSDANKQNSVPGETLAAQNEAKLQEGMSLPCRVCGDKSTGFHYGVMACEGCKGFFRRSIHKKIQYKCHLEGACSIERINRNRCQHCRFKKCLAVGMSKEAVRIGRYTKEIKKSQLAEIRRITLKPETQKERQARERKEIQLYSVGQTVLQAYQITQQYSKERVEVLQAKRKEIMEEADGGTDYPTPDIALTGMTEEQQKNPKLVAWKMYMEAMMPGVKKVVAFAKCLPGFESLRQEDQVTLLKAGFFEAWIIQLARVASPADKNFILHEDHFFSKFLLDQMEVDNFWNRVFEFSTSIQSMELGDLEVALLMGVTIISGDRSGLIDKSEASSLQELFLDCFQREMTRRDPLKTRAVAKILMQLTKLVSISMMNTENLLILLKENPGLEVPDLLVELQDLNANVSIGPNDISAQLPLPRLVDEGGLFQPPRAVACVPTSSAEWPD